MDFGQIIKGLDVLDDSVQAIQKNNRKLIRKATIAGARVILKKAKSNCPVSVEGHYVKVLKKRLPPGNLRKSLKMLALKQKYPDKQLVLVGPNTGKKAKYDGWYGRLVENGTSKTAPEPFLRPAYDEGGNEATEKMVEVFHEGLDGVFEKDFEDIGDILVDALMGGD